MDAGLAGEERALTGGTGLDPASPVAFGQAPAAARP